MALTKVTVVDKVEVLESGQVQVRTATRVLEDGTTLSSSFHRHVLAPADDLSLFPQTTFKTQHYLHTKENC